MALTELKEKLPNNLPGYLINGFLSNNHPESIRYIANYRESIKVGKSPLINMEKYAYIFNKIATTIPHRWKHKFSIYIKSDYVLISRRNSDNEIYAEMALNLADLK